MATLREQLEEAKARVGQLERAMLKASCAENGCTWVSLGGTNCDCFDGRNGCSVPVHECSVCGNCDYGDNQEADKVRQECEATR